LASATLGGITVRDLVAAGTERLGEAGCETPRLDAELLLARALGHDSRARLVLDAATTVATDRRSRFEQMLARRERREPVAYILGARPFRGISLLVDRRVLIPRPETELLVELALDLPPGISVADVGTGSGAVALALQTERPDLLVTGIDRSRDAIAVARRNAEVLRLSEVRFVRADLLDGGHYDAVLANLPYVRPGEELAPEIVSYEPPEAVYGGGEDGLDAIRRLVSVLGNGPRVRFVALEVGIGQAASVADLVSGAGFGTVVVHRDLAGHQRVVAGRR
jgi:release factor glutamine methyltransferase